MRQHPGSEEQAKKAIRLCREAGLSVYIKDSDLSARAMIWQSISLDNQRKIYHCLPVKTTSKRFSEDFLICTAFQEKPCVMANGDVVPCSPVAGYNALHNIHMGNVFTDGLQNLLTSGPFASALTMTVGEKLCENQECRECKYVKNCHGGCPALALAMGGSMLSCDPLKCIYFKPGLFIYPEAQSIHQLASLSET